ncbi:hypothetical protein D3C79_955360 [compost metagenome]
MGTRLAVEQADLAEPVRRFDQGQQRLFAIGSHRPHAHRPVEQRIQPARRITALEQVLPGCQLSLPGQRQQAILKAGRQRLEPMTLQQGFAHSASKVSSVG